MNQKEKISIALKKAKTSLEKILILIEAEDPDCFSVIQQNLSVIGLLRSVNLLMLESHMERSSKKLPSSQTKQFKIFQKELLKIIQTAQNK
ncbi:MAG: metal-sensing transcriptional repressor [Candidatus Moraniibacteriota bacterium]|nr:MAG: metal-sensing transcriptional repressor [Candidatus Moranbacteria bacterium]